MATTKTTAEFALGVTFSPAKIAARAKVTDALDAHHLALADLRRRRIGSTAYAKSNAAQLAAWAAVLAALAECRNTL